MIRFAHDIKNVFHIVIIFQCILFSAYLLTLRNEKRQMNLLLVSFLIVKIITEMGGIFWHFISLRQIIFSECPQLLLIELPFRFLYVPFLFLYVLSFLEGHLKFRKYHLLHFFPFILFVAFTIQKLLAIESDTLRDLLRTGAHLSSTEHGMVFVFEHIQFYGYAFAALILLKKYRLRVKDIYSTVEQINLSWLNFVLWGFICWKSLGLIEYILWIIFKLPNLFFIYILAEVIFLTVVSLMFLKGLRQPIIFSGSNNDKNRIKYEKTSLSDDIKENYKNKLLNYVNKHKPYLDSTLSLQDLAEKLNIPAHHLSQVLNTTLNQKFFDFINTYRIEESKRLLKDYNKNITEVLYETGFNSKSVFNKAFKKYTGMTPSEFRLKK